MEIKVDFEGLKYGEESPYLSLGDLTFVDDRTGVSITTANQYPNRSMMIFASFSDLLEKLIALHKHNRREVIFSGFGSSIDFTFAIDRDQLVVTACGQQVSGNFHLAMQSIYKNAIYLLNCLHNQTNLLADEYSDLAESIQDFKSYFSATGLLLSA